MDGVRGLRTPLITDSRTIDGAESLFLYGVLLRFNRAIVGSFESLPRTLCIHKAQLQERELSSPNPMPWISTTAREASQALPQYQSCTVSARRQCATSGLEERGRRRHGIWTRLERSRSGRWGGRWDAKTRNQGSREAYVQSPIPFLGLTKYLPNRNRQTWRVSFAWR